jgi:ELWxxDGT repeat protein
VLFQGVDPSGQYGLWVTNGSAAGTREVVPIFGASAKFDPLGMTVFNNEVLFEGSNASNKFGLWVTDGTAGGTHEVTGIIGASLGFFPSDLTVFRLNIVSNAKALFSGVNTNGQAGLWVTDGAGAGTHELTGISGANMTSGLQPGDLTVFTPGSFGFSPARALFNGLNASGVRGLWVTDGTAAGTHEVATFGGGTFGTAGPDDLTTFGNRASGCHEVLFLATNASLVTNA